MSAGIILVRVISPPPSVTTGDSSGQTAEVTTLRTALKARDRELGDTQEALTNAQRSLDEGARKVAALQSQLAAAESKRPPYMQKMGPVNALNASSNAEDIVIDLANNETSLLITSVSENKEFRNDLTNIFNVGLYKWMASHPKGQLSKQSLMIEPPNYDINVDAPKLPPADHSGIVVHGEGDLPDKIRTFLGHCFVVRKAQRNPEELSVFYKRNLIWIEIGHDPVWKNKTGGEHLACDE